MRQKEGLGKPRIPDTREYRAACGGAELILFVWRDHAIKFVLRVERAIAEKLPQIAMVPVCAARGDDIDNASHGAAIGRALVVGLHLEFLDGIDDGSNRIIPDEGVVCKSIEQKHVAAVCLPIHRRKVIGTDRVPRPSTAPSGILPSTDRGNTRSESEKLGKVAPVERKARNLPGLDRRS
jgi:hypothetical protein